MPARVRRFNRARGGAVAPPRAGINSVREQWEPRLWRNLFGILLFIFLAILGYCGVIFTIIWHKNLLAKGAKQSKAARRASQTRRSPQGVPGGTVKGFNNVWVPGFRF